MLYEDVRCLLVPRTDLPRDARDIVTLIHRKTRLQFKC